MLEYFYCPILKTRQSEVDAYDMLDPSVKDSILPIIEMTGALGYTYPKNYKIEGIKMKQIKIEQLLPLLKSGWVAMDKDGGWKWHYRNPKTTRLYTWLSNIKSYNEFSNLSYCFNIAPFDGDWKDSLIKVKQKEEV